MEFWRSTQCLGEHVAHERRIVDNQNAGCGHVNDSKSQKNSTSPASKDDCRTARCLAASKCAMVRLSARVSTGLSVDATARLAGASTSAPTASRRACAAL